MTDEQALNRVAEAVLLKKKVLFFTKSLSLTEISLISPFSPALAGGMIARKLAGTEGVDGEISITNQHLFFKSGFFDRFLLGQDVQFSLDLKDIISVETGKKLFKKTVIFNTNKGRFEFSLFGVNKFISGLKKVHPNLFRG